MATAMNAGRTSWSAGKAILAAGLTALGASLMLALGGCAVDAGQGELSGLEQDPSAGEETGGETRAPVDRGADGKADGQCGPFPSYYYRYLDDTSCVKRIPTDQNRDLVCPTIASGTTVTTAGGEEVVYRPAGQIEVDANALKGVVPDDLKITLILVRRVDGIPHYRYLSNGHHNDIVQPWSSTKFMAIANGASRLRTASNYKVGLTGSVDGWPLGDLVTMVHAYDEKHFTSNGLSRYFHDVGGRANAQKLITDWLDRPAAETFGGNYGAPSAALGFSFKDGTSSVAISPDASGGRDNQLSTLTLAEFLKRLVMHREDAATRLPGLQWADLQTLFYGAAKSRIYGATRPQGMQADTAVYLQQAFDVSAMEARSQGQWRIFSKLGHGQSRGGEFVHAGYACLPKLDSAGKPVPEQGKELVIASYLNAGGKLPEADGRLAAAYRAVVERVIDGRLK